MMVLILCSCHFCSNNFMYASQSDFLKLFWILLPSPSRLPSSSHVLISKFVNNEDSCTALLWLVVHTPLSPALHVSSKSAFNPNYGMYSSFKFHYACNLGKVYWCMCLELGFISWVKFPPETYHMTVWYRNRPPRIQASPFSTTHLQDQGSSTQPQDFTN